MFKKLIYNFDIALDAIKQNTMRSFLTSLGIIFGVASVIAMLAIGQGAQQEVLQQMQLLGTNNVIIEPVVRQMEGDVQQVEGPAQDENRYSPGLTLQDMESIVANISNIESVSPEIVFDTEIIRNGRLRSGKLIGVSKEYFDINSFSFADGGTFSDIQVRDSDPVCIIGSDIENRFFAGEQALGNKIKAGNIWFTVVGVLEKREISTENIENLGIRNYNLDIYTPATTVLLRYKNRGVLTGQDIQSAAANNGSENTSGQNYHQLDKLIVRVSDNRFSVPISDVIRRMLTRRHNNVIDFEVIVPELLLQQERRTQNIFNIVLSSIASISLLVGGIGIMNIMLASVVERIREIGVRRAVGALKQDIKFQFLTEALTISISGGIIGIILGIAFSYIIEITAGIQTIVTLYSIVISFGVAMSIGVVFGYFPAKRAAEQDPVKSLHHE
ncbi:ABC transporter permease [Rhodohalobacter sp. 8-1]|uniref:ABC transporter permease n=1 Tax=Rhodohalobacter sp. 8-1 TaxID=3131972 RepID=UPI0030EC2649